MIDAKNQDLQPDVERILRAIVAPTLGELVPTQSPLLFDKICREVASAITLKLPERNEFAMVCKYFLCEASEVHDIPALYSVNESDRTLTVHYEIEDTEP